MIAITRLQRVHGVVLAIALGLCGPAVAGQKVTVSKADCTKIVNHHPNADIAYKPDPRFAPADLPNANAPKLNDETTIDLNVDLTKFGLNAATTKLSNPAANVGKVTIGRDGKVSMNGQPLSNPEEEALAKACAARR